MRESRDSVATRANGALGRPTSPVLRYPDRASSALFVAETFEFGGQAGTEIAGRFGEKVLVRRGWNDLAGRYQIGPWVTACGHDTRHQLSALRHLDGFTSRNPREVAAGILPEFPEADALHVAHGSTFAN